MSHPTSRKFYPWPQQPVSSKRNHLVHGWQPDKCEKMSCLNVYCRKRGRMGVKQMHAFLPLLTLFTIGIYCVNYFRFFVSKNCLFYGRNPRSASAFDAGSREFFLRDEGRACDMPMQLQFDFHFSRAMKEHLNTSCQIWLEVFNSTEDGPTFSSTVDKVTSAANERMAHEVW
jgi:hypothetical protein